MGKLEGVIVAMLTSFNREGAVDREKTENILNFLKDKVDGFFICGTYGCGQLMSDEQREEVLEIVCNIINNIPIIVNVSASSMESTMKLIKHAEYSGATYLSCTPPTYYSFKEDEILFYYEKLVKSSKLPLYAYNIPKFVSNNISGGMLKNLEEIGICGIKDSSFDINLINDYMNNINKENFNIAIGTSSIFLSASVLGIKTIISGLSNAFPEIEKVLFNLCANKKYEVALKAQNIILDIIKILYSNGSPIQTMYDFLRFRGIEPGFPKMPFKPLNSRLRKIIFKELQLIKKRFEDLYYDKEVTSKLMR